MKAIFTTILFCLTVQIVFSQEFFKLFPSNLNTDVETSTGVLEISKYYYKCETEFNTVNSHFNIRIIKTDSLGNTTWIKRIDTHPDSSLVAVEIIKSHDNKLLITCQHDFNNSPNADAAAIVKIDTNGNFIWSKKYSGTWGFRSKMLPLQDSTYIFSVLDSVQGKPKIIKIDQNGNVIKSKKLQTPNTSYYTHGLSFKGNKIYFAFDKGVFLITDTALNLLQQINYSLDQLTMPYFNHLRTSNNENIFVSCRLSGGGLNGQFRIFRVKDDGTVLWAKNVKAWKTTTNFNQFNVFDYTLCESIHEDTSGNIIVNMIEEDLNSLIHVFNANGNLISQKFTQASSLQFCSDGDVLIADNFGVKKLFSKFNLNSVLNCDSASTVLISNGVDSLSVSQPTFGLINDSPFTKGFSINITNSTSLSGDFCQMILTGIGSNQSKKAIPNIIYPNPSGNITYINPALENVTEVTITNTLGEVKLLKPANNQLDLQDLNEGIYLVSIKSNGQVYSARLIKTK